MTEVSAPVVASTKPTSRIVSSAVVSVGKALKSASSSATSSERKRPAMQTDEEGRKRSKRFSGLLMGHLKKASTEAEKESEALKKQKQKLNQVEKKIKIEKEEVKKIVASEPPRSRQPQERRTPFVASSVTSRLGIRRSNREGDVKEQRAVRSEIRVRNPQQSSSSSSRDKYGGGAASTATRRPPYRDLVPVSGIPQEKFNHTKVEPSLLWLDADELREFENKSSSTKQDAYSPSHSPSRSRSSSRSRSHSPAK